MIKLFIASLILFTILSLLTNIFIMKGTYKKFLYILIPIQLTLATFGYIAIDSVMGYATKNISELQIENHKFTYVYHFMSGDDLYLIAKPYKSSNPRFYIFVGDTGSNKEKIKKMMKSLNEAGKQAKKGIMSEGFLDMPQTEMKWKIKDYQQISPKE